MRVIAANNDAQVRVFDTEKYTCMNQFSFPWSVNVSILRFPLDLQTFGFLQMYWFKF